MKKHLVIFAAVILMVSGAYAQMTTSRQMTAKELHKMQLNTAKQSAKITGNPIWGDTMSYCGNEPYYTGVGTNGSGVYWGIKLEADALVGRNTIEAVQFFVGDASNGIGSYTMTIRQDSLTATPLLTENITTTAADTMAWKTITLATPLAIAQGHDLYVCLYNASLPYPAAAITANNYDNGKWASVNGTEWDLVSNLGVDATWMIRAISDTHIELPPFVSIEGPATVRMNDTAVFTAVSPNADSYSWNVTADYTYESGNTITVVWESDGLMTVEVSATNTVGTTTASMDVDVIDCSDAIDEFPYTETFEAPIPCWSTISNDPANDDAFGITDEVAYQGVSSFGFSSYNTADDYNQYLISPEIELPTTGDYMVSFRYYAYSNGESFRVMVSSTNTNISSFTTLYEMESTPMTEEWVEARVQLPQNTKYICINYYGDWAYFLYIDNLAITTLSEPDLLLSGVNTIGTGVPTTYSVLSSMANTFSWSVDGVAQSATGTTLSYTFDTPGNHTVEVSATNSVGTATESLTVDVFDCRGTTLPYAPDFTESLGCWYNNAQGESESGWYLCSEAGIDGQIYSMSAQSIFGMFMSDLYPDNWVISPSIAMPANGSYDLTWKVMTYASEYPTDHYAAYVIAEDGTETMLHEETLAAHNNHFAQRVANIPANVNGNFRVAFRHFDTEGGYVLILDQIQIVEAGTVTGIDNVAANGISVFPNPVSSELNISGEGVQKVELMDLTGRVVLTSSATKMNIADIAAGMYMVRVTSANGISVTKIVKE